MCKKRARFIAQNYFETVTHNLISYYYIDRVHKFLPNAHLVRTKAHATNNQGIISEICTLDGFSAGEEAGRFWKETNEKKDHLQWQVKGFLF